MGRQLSRDDRPYQCRFWWFCTRNMLQNTLFYVVVHFLSVSEFQAEGVSIAFLMVLHSKGLENSTVIVVLLWHQSCST